MDNLHQTLESRFGKYRNGGYSILAGITIVNGSIFEDPEETVLKIEKSLQSYYEEYKSKHKECKYDETMSGFGSGRRVGKKKENGYCFILYLTIA